MTPGLHPPAQDGDWVIDLVAAGRADLGGGRDARPTACYQGFRLKVRLLQLPVPPLVGHQDKLVGPLVDDISGVAIRGEALKIDEFKLLVSRSANMATTVPELVSRTLASKATVLTAPVDLEITVAAAPPP